jgi:hypothetical protein
MILARFLSYLDTYAVWLYAAGLAAALLTLYELRQARKSRAETIFNLEQEFAVAREKRARNTLILVLAFLILLTLLQFAVIPSQSLPTPEPTPTKLILEPPTAVQPTFTPTSTRVPTRPRPTALPPTSTPTVTRVPPPPCPRPDICITFPRDGQVLANEATILGAANIPSFQFYKIEYGLGEEPKEWHSIGDIRRTPVVDGSLAVWQIAGFPNGVYKLRLTVVDISGNFPPPHEVRVIIQQ